MRCIGIWHLYYSQLLQGQYLITNILGIGTALVVSSTYIPFSFKQHICQLQH